MKAICRLAGDGEPVDGARMLGETAEAMRPKRGADDEETEDRADLEAVHDRRHDRRRAQHDQGILEDEDFGRSRHCAQHRL